MLFSIITVTRNNLDGLKKTAASLAAQSFQGFEWLVIDGASTDGTLDYLKDIEACYVSEPDDGIYDAMNKGIDKAEGFYVLFLNAGDCLAGTDVLAAIASDLENMQSTPDFIYGDALETGAQDTPQIKPARPYQKSAYGMFTHHQAMLYRNETIGTLRYDQSYMIAADYKFTLQFLQQSNAVLYCPFPICLFESGGISQQQAARGRTEQIRIRDELKTVSPLKNRIIATQQSLVWTIRQSCPVLYWAIKSKR
ncbi:MAG: glycosyltransferase [Rhodospirillales bacterium]|nr:glycosyltransferase [Rhodospirillales bacterium]MCB9996429.1 glycosyltransferase [Rhodospirillales bacterium]